MGSPINHISSNLNQDIDFGHGAATPYQAEQEQTVLSGLRQCPNLHTASKQTQLTANPNFRSNMEKRSQSRNSDERDLESQVLIAQAFSPVFNEKLGFTRGELSTQELKQDTTSSANQGNQGNPSTNKIFNNKFLGFQLTF